MNEFLCKVKSARIHKHRILTGMVKQSFAESLPLIKTAGHPSITHFRLSTLFPVLLVTLARQYMFACLNTSNVFLSMKQ